ncbi:hypothetical protein SAMN04487781_4015 [Cellulosimicrobium cellulans]|nr:hypothetical protein SAMN04487781_4015 [Cellulosimicrobium cellulans]
MSLRDRLAAKRRRTTTIPIQVEDDTVQRADVETARRALFAATIGDGSTPEVKAAAQEAVDAAEAALAATREDVVFQALSPDDAERIWSEHTGEDGQLVPATSLPVLAAACAVDPDLQDEAWWAAQLNGDSWSLGERDGLYRELLDLNLSRPRPGTPKG